ncbi:MAG TPA: hypothetical protein VJS66_00445 [Burkholderiales bacterium]|nr:hypothetical protein [Burkholderiales bacterium]
MPLTTRAIARFIFPILLGVASLTSVSAHAADPTLKKIVQIAAIALGEPALNDAVDLIDCVRVHGAQHCAQSAAQAEGQKTAKQLLPDDPKIAATVKIVKAAYASDWLDVLELTGTEALVPIACSAGLAIGGPLKTFICGEASKFSKPIVKIVLVAIKNPSPDNLLKAIAALGNPNLACSLIDFPGKDAICGPLGDIINGVANGVKSAVDALGGLAEDIAGQTHHISVEDYYILYWRSWLHYAVVKQLQFGQPHYLFAGRKGGETCVDYFDSHKMSESNANKVCNIMKGRFKQEVDQTVNVFEAYPSAFSAAAMAPQLNSWTIQYYGKIDAFANFFGQTQSWNGSALLTYLYNNKPPFFSMWGECQKHVPLKLPPIPSGGAGVHPAEKGNMGTAYSWACVTAVGRQLSTALAKEKANVTAKLVPAQAAAGCGLKSLAESPKLYFVCTSYESWNQCKATVLGAPNQSYCGLDGIAAATKLAAQIADELGHKRCQVTTSNTRNVECTRPWKQQKCLALVKHYAAGAGSWAGNTTCSLKNDPGFVQGKTKAQDILNLLNGAKKVGKAVGSDGKAEQLVLMPPIKPCSHQFDLLAIRCTDPDVLAPFKGRSDLALTQCRPDPNQDGADQPCYVIPLKIDSAKTAPLSSKAHDPSPPKAPKQTKDDPAAPKTKAVVSMQAVPAPPIPQLAVLSLQTKIEPNCQSPQPALTASVNIKNSGGSMTVNRGTITLKEIAGDNLSSAVVPLPAIGAGQTQIVSISAMTPQPYATLAGVHQIEVVLAPQDTAGQPSFIKPAMPYQFAVTFPAGHCAAPQRAQPEAPARSRLPGR